LVTYSSCWPPEAGNSRIGISRARRASRLPKKWFLRLGLSDMASPRLLLQTIDVGVGDVGIDSVAVSPDGTRIATGMTDGRAAVWDLASRNRMLSLSGHSGRVWAVAFSPDGERLATGSADTSIRIWDLDSPKP